MDSSFETMKAGYGPRVCSICSAAIAAVILQVLDLKLPYWMRAFGVHAVRFNSRASYSWLLVTHLRISLLPYDWICRSEYFYGTLIVNAGAAFWMHIKSDTSENPEFDAWVASQDAVVTYVWFQLALANPSQTWGGLKAAAFVFTTTICGSVGLWFLLHSRYPGLWSKIQFAVAAVLSFPVACLAEFEILTVVLGEDLPKLIQREYIKFSMKRENAPRVLHYNYNPLEPGSVRLLLLRKNSYLLPSMIEAELVHVWMKEGLWPLELCDYEAVSYRWGSSERVHSILINGCLFAVTESAFDILLSLRSTFRDRVLWIDAICINQEDHNEKSQQVELMRDIYQNASRVIVYPGSGWQFRLAAQMILELRVALQISWIDLSRTRLKYARSRSALMRLLTHEYFTRAWIVQEIAVAPKVDLYLAGKYLSWDTFFETAEALFKPERRHSIAQNSSEGSMRALPKSCYGNLVVLNALNQVSGPNRHYLPQPTLEDVIFFTRGFRATDARDLLFALLGLVGHGFIHKLIRPDYTKSCEEVFVNVARYVLMYQDEPSVNILALAGIGNPKTRRPLPSWVPDLSQELINDPFTNVYLAPNRFRASGESQAKVKEGPNPNVLAVGGVLCNTVVAVNQDTLIDEIIDKGDTIDVYHTSKSKLDFAMAAMTLIQKHSKLWRDGPSSALNRLWSVLVANRVNTRSECPSSEYQDVFGLWFGFSKEWVRASFQENVKLAERGWFSHYEPYFAEIRGYGFDMTLACARRCFAISDEGRLCLVPRLSQEGDVIFIPHGAQTPYLIRRCDLEETTIAYELIGEAFVDGIMEGEIMSNGLKEVTVHLK